MVDLVNLRTFVTAATAGSFSKAAARLNVSPAMVGRRILALEEDYGVKLIERTTRSQRLTETGQEFLAKATRILEEVEALADIAHPQAEDLVGHIRISGSTTLGVKRLTPALARFTNAHPAVSVEMALLDRNVDLVAEGYDLAFRIGNLKPSSLIARRIGTYDFACCASPDYFRRMGTPTHPDELGNHRCVISLNLSPRDLWRFWDAEGREVLAAVRGNFGVDNGEAMRAAALEGVGLAYAPRVLVEEDLESGALVEVLTGWRKLALPIHAVYPSRQFVPRRLAGVIEWIARELREG
ncbi:LysR family transcriptional regulator [Devosia riboflavina]|uniref:LysR family transcriptional regulator n=1 Tax=Devosia riboflavina TaxID=46914 RepID=A0A087M678_9HYPH|nr:LysR family transcriptional regulator [Devosia riboflavina]KFL32381.1 LysR family transcriptional regulator [Devosia riboflavina]